MPEASFRGGLRYAGRSVFAYVLFGTYVGLGALALDFGFSALWLSLSTVFMWAAPAQVIIISGLGGGASLIEVALAVTLSAVRLLPMVVALMPVVRGPRTPTWQLALIAHMTAISMWVESLRLLPAMPREQRARFCMGLGTGLISAAVAGGLVGFYLTAGLPVVLAAGLLFLTPLSFLVSVARNSKTLVERTAFGLGFVVAPLLAAYKIELDLLWTGIIGGTLGFAAHRLREALRREAPR
jgi:predicted branched-subunit amino acid permease